MQETFFVIVETEDGKLLIREKITCDSSNLYWQVSQLFNRFSLVGVDIPKSKIEPGSGTQLSASRLPSPTER